MPALKYWNGTAWATISSVPGPPGPAGPQGPVGGDSSADTEEFLPAAAATTVTLSRTVMDVLVVTRDGIVQSEIDGHWTRSGSVITFTDPFTGDERVQVMYCFGTIGAAGPMGPSASLHEEFLPAYAATTVTLGQVPQSILIVARNGVVQSAVAGNYTIAGTVLTFTDAFSGTERVVVEYAQQTTSPAPPFNGAGITDNSTPGAKLVDKSVTNIKLAADVARANQLTNGGFEIWQRGAGPFTANDVYTADRWKTIVAGSGSATRYTGATVEAGSGLYVMGITLAAGASYFLLDQKLEHYLALRNKYVSLSVRTYSAPTGAMQVQLWSTGGAAPIDIRAFNTSTANQTVTVTGFVPSDATGVGVRVGMILPGTGYVDNAMLVVGNVPADYQPLHPAEDLIRCQRYYEVVGNPGAGDVCVAGYAAGASVNWHWQMMWQVTKAVAPVCTKVGTWQIANATQPAIAVGTLYGAQAYYGSLGAGYILAHNTGGGCCFTIEANP